MVPIFLNRSLSISTKRDVYEAVVLSVLLYGAETWTVKAPDVRRLTTFQTIVFEQYWVCHVSSSGGNTLPLDS